MRRIAAGIAQILRVVRPRVAHADHVAGDDGARERQRHDAAQDRDAGDRHGLRIGHDREALDRRGRAREGLREDDGHTRPVRGHRRRRDGRNPGVDRDRRHRRAGTGIAGGVGVASRRDGNRRAAGLDIRARREDGGPCRTGSRDRAERATGHRDVGGRETRPWILAEGEGDGRRLARLQRAPVAGDRQGRCARVDGKRPRQGCGSAGVARGILIRRGGDRDRRRAGGITRGREQRRARRSGTAESAQRTAGHLDIGGREARPGILAEGEGDGRALARLHRRTVARDGEGRRARVDGDGWHRLKDAGIAGRVDETTGREGNRCRPREIAVRREQDATGQAGAAHLAQRAAGDHQVLAAETDTRILGEGQGQRRRLPADQRGIAGRDGQARRLGVDQDLTVRARPRIADEVLIAVCGHGERNGARRPVRRNIGDGEAVVRAAHQGAQRAGRDRDVVAIEAGDRLGEGDRHHRGLAALQHRVVDGDRRLRRRAVEGGKHERDVARRDVAAEITQLCRSNAERIAGQERRALAGDNLEDARPAARGVDGDEARAGTEALAAGQRDVGERERIGHRLGKGDADLRAQRIDRDPGIVRRHGVDFVGQHALGLVAGAIGRAHADRVHAIGARHRVGQRVLCAGPDESVLEGPVIVPVDLNGRVGLGREAQIGRRILDAHDAAGPHAIHEDE